MNREESRRLYPLSSEVCRIRWYLPNCEDRSKKWHPLNSEVCRKRWYPRSCDENRERWYQLSCEDNRKIWCPLRSEEQWESWQPLSCEERRFWIVLWWPIKCLSAVYTSSVIFINSPFSNSRRLVNQSDLNIYEQRHELVHVPPLRVVISVWVRVVYFLTFFTLPWRYKGTFVSWIPFLYPFCPFRYLFYPICSFCEDKEAWPSTVAPAAKVGSKKEKRTFCWPLKKWK